MSEQKLTYNGSEPKLMQVSINAQITINGKPVQSAPIIQLVEVEPDDVIGIKTPTILIQEC